MSILTIGKGLVESGPPYRQAYFFGASVAPNASNWNYVAQIVEAASSFDFSAIKPGQFGPVQLSLQG